MQLNIITSTESHIFHGFTAPRGERPCQGSTGLKSCMVQDETGDTVSLRGISEGMLEFQSTATRNVPEGINVRQRSKCPCGSCTTS
jgi:hypothetical protein